MCGFRGWEAAYCCLMIANSTKLLYKDRKIPIELAQDGGRFQTLLFASIIPAQLLSSRSEYFGFGDIQGVQLAAF